MAKNDWIAGDTGTRTNMNLPHWLASGTYNSGSNRLEIQVSPGWWRYPQQPSLVGSGGPTQVLITAPQASTYYTLFLRGDNTYMVSGSTSSSVPGSPRWDAEPIGTVFTGVSVSTANLKGPWNQTATGQYERRGEATAVQALVPRLIYDSRAAATLSASIGSMDATRAPIVTTSGLSFLSFGHFRPTGPVILNAAIQWVPSGNISRAGSAAAIVVSPVFLVYNAVGGAPGQLIYSFQDTREFGTVQNPDSGSSANYSPCLTSFQAIDVVGSGTGYSLIISPPDYFGNNLRFVSITFTAQPGVFQASNYVEP